MSKITEFYAKVMSEKELQKEFMRILEGKTIEYASKEQLEEMGVLAKKVGYEITMEEIQEYLKGEDSELDEMDLDAVAGGKGVYVQVDNRATGSNTGFIKVSPFV